jgi:hemerythrin
MEWHDSYYIGIEKIDQQHKELVQMVSRLQETLLHGDIHKEIGNGLRFLVDYTKHHFHDEEEIMTSMNYEDLPHHKELHKKLINEVVLVLMEIKKGKAVDPLSLIDFLVDWLINHVLYEDKKIGKFLMAANTNRSKF